MAEASGKTASVVGGGGEWRKQCYTICTSSVPGNPAHRLPERDEGTTRGDCSDRRPGGALMVTDKVLCRGLMEPDGLIHESQLPARRRGGGCWLPVSFPGGLQIGILEGHLLPTTFLGFTVPIINP